MSSDVKPSVCAGLAWVRRQEHDPNAVAMMTVNIRNIAVATANAVTRRRTVVASSMMFISHHPARTGRLDD